MIPPRAAMVLACLLGRPRQPPHLTADDVHRLAAQFNTSPGAVERLTDRVLLDISTAGSTLDSCQPRNAKRCPCCGAVAP